MLKLSECASMFFTICRRYCSAWRQFLREAWVAHSAYNSRSLTWFNRNYHVSIVLENKETLNFCLSLYIDAAPGLTSKWHQMAIGIITDSMKLKLWQYIAVFVSGKFNVWGVDFSLHLPPRQHAMAVLVLTSNGHHTHCRFNGDVWFRPKCFTKKITL